MKLITFIRDIAKKYPQQFLFTIVLMLILNFIEMGSILTLLCAQKRKCYELAKMQGMA